MTDTTGIFDPQNLDAVDIITYRDCAEGVTRRFGICQHKASALYYVTLDLQHSHPVTGTCYARHTHNANNAVRISIRAAMNRYRGNPERTIEQLIRDFVTVLGPYTCDVSASL